MRVTIEEISREQEEEIILRCHQVVANLGKWSVGSRRCKRASLAFGVTRYTALQLTIFTILKLWTASRFLLQRGGI